MLENCTPLLPYHLMEYHLLKYHRYQRDRLGRDQSDGENSDVDHHCANSRMIQIFDQIWLICDTNIRSNSRMIKTYALIVDQIWLIQVFDCTRYDTLHEVMRLYWVEKIKRFMNVNMSMHIFIYPTYFILSINLIYLFKNSNDDDEEIIGWWDYRMMHSYLLLSSSFIIDRHMSCWNRWFLHFKQE